jgi:hypothetical protein
MATRVIEPTKYVRSYTDFRGVDFSSDQVLVKPNRLPFAINVYKDYKSSQGQALETFPGFDKAVILPENEKVYKLFPFKYNGENEVILIHAGTKLYVWDNYPYTMNIVKQNAPHILSVENGSLQYSFALDTKGAIISKVELIKHNTTEVIVCNENVVIGAEIKTFATLNTVNNVTTVTLQPQVIWSGETDNYALAEGDKIIVYYYEKILSGADAIYNEMNDAQSSFFVYNKVQADGTNLPVCYINDGANYLKVYYNIMTSRIVCERVYGYVPTTYINRIPHMELNLASEGTQLEQVNILNTDFSNTFISPTRRCYTLSTKLTSTTNLNTITQTLTGDPANGLKHKIKIEYALGGTLSNAYDVFELTSSLFGKDSSGNTLSQTLYIPIETTDTAQTVLDKLGTALMGDTLITTYFKILPNAGYLEIEAIDNYNIASVYQLSESNLDDDITVKVYGIEKTIGTDYTYDKTNGKIIFIPSFSWNASNTELTISGIPTAPEDNSQEAGYAGIEITAKRALNEYSLISKCTINTVYDNRAFFSGNPEHPNTVYYSMLNDPSYIGEYCFFEDGKGQEKITGMMQVADTLMVLKEDTLNESAFYYHRGIDTNNEIMPRTYTTAGGLSNLGCIGGFTNFMDDPVFVSRLGIEAIGQLSERLERAIEHRSSMIDGQFTNESAGLNSCILEEWNGYLIALIGGKMYLADSRQTYQDNLGNKQYEWYYIEGVGVYDGQFKAHYWKESIPEEWKNPISNYTYDDLTKTINYDGKVLQLINSQTILVNGKLANRNNEEIKHTGTLISDINGNNYVFSIPYIEYFDGENALYYIVEEKDFYTGGTFKKALSITSYKDNLIFGTENGVVCAFHFDKRSEGIIANKYYSFDGRIITSGVATVFDNCGAPHMLKTTAKKSLVVKCKTLSHSEMKIKVRTNDGNFRIVGNIKNGYFTFDDIDFSDMTFNLNEQNTFVVNERMKKWVEKQIFIYSDTLMRPFSLYHILYSYYIVGKVK